MTDMLYHGPISAKPIGHKWGFGVAIAIGNETLINIIVVRTYTNYSVHFTMVP